VVELTGLQILLLVVALSGAVILALCAWGIRTVHDATTTSRTLSRRKMPRALRAAIDESEADFQAAGFRHVADLKTTRRGISSLARFYLTSDNLVVAEIAAHRFLGLSSAGIAYALTSILDDGTILQTIHHDRIPDAVGEPSAESKMVLIPTGSTNPIVLLGRHRDELAKRQQQDRRSTAIQPDLIPELNRYIYQLADWELYRQGKLPEPPPEAAVGGR
jgi:hypothetical protein